MWLFLYINKATRFIISVENDDVRHRGNRGQYMSHVSVGGYGIIQQGQKSMSNDNLK